MWKLYVKIKNAYFLKKDKLFLQIKGFWTLKHLNNKSIANLVNKKKNTDSSVKF